MNRFEFKKLSDNYLKGKATPEEEKKLLQVYDFLQDNDQEWDTERLGDKETARTRIYQNVLEKIDRKERRSRMMARKWSVAASITVFLTLCSLLYYYREPALNYIDPVQMAESKASRGKIMQLVLADGTNVWLNAESELKYPMKFRGNTREVTLTGEAYFEVAHNKEKPFIIRSGEVTTKVLGTSFNIRAVKGEKRIEVAVLTGKVRVSARGPEAGKRDVLILPDERAVYNRSKHSLASEKGIDAAREIAWKDGRTIFRNTPLPLAIAELERKYDVDIEINKNLESCRVHADFENEPVDKILELLAESLQGKITSSSKSRYRLTGQGCAIKDLTNNQP